jgi:hypothetical protein
MLMYGLNTENSHIARVSTLLFLGVRFSAFLQPHVHREVIAIAKAMEFAAHAPSDISVQALTQAFIRHRNVPPENTAVQQDYQLFQATARKDLIQLEAQQI